ncbi:hypothetical protein AB4Z22_16115, partial [Paenibacillus sp. TAF58]
RPPFHSFTNIIRVKPKYCQSIEAGKINYNDHYHKYNLSQTWGLTAAMRRRAQDSRALGRSYDDQFDKDLLHKPSPFH